MDGKKNIVDAEFEVVREQEEVLQLPSTDLQTSEKEITQHDVIELMKNNDEVGLLNLIKEGKVIPMAASDKHRLVERARERNMIIHAFNLYAKGISPLTSQYEHLKEYFKPETVKFDSLSTEEKDKVRQTIFNQLPTVEQIHYGSWQNLNLKPGTYIRRNVFNWLKMGKDIGVLATKMVGKSSDPFKHMPLIKGSFAVIQSEDNVFSQIDFTPLLDIFMNSMDKGEVDLEQLIGFGNKLKEIGKIEILN